MGMPAPRPTCRGKRTGDEPSRTATHTYDYIVIGSGPGGGPLAANLALAGFDVLVLEAGDEIGGPRYDVPAFHALATEDAAVRWDYYVHHFPDEATRARNPKYERERQGVWYPRAAAVGGCAALNAMITIFPPDCDWDYIADLMGDDAWRSDRMWRYVALLENCGYRSKWLGRASGHGFAGWLRTETADARPALADPELLTLIFSAARTVHHDGAGGTWRRLLRRFDPNDRRLTQRHPAGVASVPLAMRRARRMGPRERLRSVERQCRNLTIRTGTLATRLLLDGDRRAVGVEYVEGRGLYRAAPGADPAAPLPARRVAWLRRELIVCAGAFNSPQLLMLSGIGAGEELRAHGIEPLLDLPGVGKNLQDHYEISVVSKMRRPFRVLREARFEIPADGARDAAYAAWLAGKGAYSSSGCVMGIFHQSGAADARDGPDLFIFGAPADFRGYDHGYSARLTAERDRFSWIVLKARPRTAAGRVSLASSDPRQPPRVDLAFFPEGDPGAARDLAAMVEGVRFVQGMNRRLGGRIEVQLWPPADVQSTGALREFIRHHAWSHHAACSNRMGRAGDLRSVVDGRFRVHGAKGLRVVDASVFPRIPGYFVAAAVYVIGEKATDDILEDAGRARRVGVERP